MRAPSISTAPEKSTSARAGTAICNAIRAIGRVLSYKESMQPKAYKLDDLQTLHQLFRGYRPHGGAGWLFRGQGDSRWPLIPKAGRPEYFLADIIRADNPLRFRDLARFGHWMRKVFPFAPDLPPNDYEALAYAQHHGLATRLLDWSLNPLVATYFAIRELPEVDGCVFCYSPHGFIDVKRAKLPVGGSDQALLWSRILDSGEVDANGVDADYLQGEMKELHGRAVITRAFDARMLNQRGAFTVHWPPEAGLTVAEIPYMPGTPNLSVLIIPASLKRELRAHLDDYGFSDEFIYPDADGVAGHVNWETQEMVERKRRKTDKH
ncbi:MAG: FRG domain-containing protein [Chthoniobacter sp.]|nr:FRG domain-containing protein [Chthoniobacter sp.]